MVVSLGPDKRETLPCNCERSEAISLLLTIPQRLLPPINRGRNDKSVSAMNDHEELARLKLQSTKRT